MTTIAYRDGVLAADTGINRGGDPSASMRKICRIPDGRRAAATGAASFIYGFLAWAEAGASGDAPTAKEGDTGLIVDGGPLLHVFDDCGSHKAHASLGYWATGSGTPFAFGAMHAGANAESAVRAALVHDSHTQGDVIVLSA